MKESVQSFSREADRASGRHRGTCARARPEICFDKHFQVEVSSSARIFAAHLDPHRAPPDPASPNRRDHERPDRFEGGDDVRRMLRRGGARPDEDGRCDLVSPADFPASRTAPRRRRPGTSGVGSARPAARRPRDAPHHPRAPLRGLGRPRFSSRFHLTDRPTNAFSCPLARASRAVPQASSPST